MTRLRMDNHARLVWKCDLISEEFRPELAIAGNVSEAFPAFFMS